MRLLVRAISSAFGCVIALVVLPTAPARAVIVTTPFDTPTLSAPANDPGWNNVARMSGASAVYLGNRWMISANHVTDAPVHFSDGRVFNIAPATDVQLVTPNSPTPLVGADIQMFRLSTDPGLPALAIAETSPRAGTEVTMIGAGRDRDPTQVGWRVDASDTWTQGPLSTDNALGFLLKDTSHMRWGVNQTLGTAPTYSASNNTLVFSTRYDRQGVPFEAQATVGDSGGGVFELVNGAWKLAGIMNTATPPVPNQPSNAVAFGDQTQCADLASYREAIMGLVTRPDPAWQNQVNCYDVDHSGRVNAHDVLLVISELEKGTPGRTLPATRGSNDFYFDVNGDGKLGANDATALISALLQRKANPTLASPSSALFVPEPATSVLAATAALVLLAGRWIRRRNRATG